MRYCPYGTDYLWVGCARKCWKEKREKFGRAVNKIKAINALKAKPKLTRRGSGRFGQLREGESFQCAGSFIDENNSA